MTIHRQRGRIALLTVTTVAAALLVAAPAAEAAGPTVSSWVTTPDRTQLLAPGASPTFTSDGTPPGQLITVDPNQTFQTMDGFGASITDSSAALLYRLPAAQRDQVMTSLFHPTNGIGLSLLRQPVGGSDFIDEAHYTYNDLPAGQTDLPQARFSVAHDEAQILPLLRRARELNPNLKVIASPWGQPAWMKANNSIIGGRLKNDPAIFRSYALYLLKFVQAYQAAGVPVYALTVQNEPQNRTPDSYAGTDMPVAHQTAVINELGPMLRDAGLTTKIISFDHNWSEHPDDIADANQLGVDPELNYPYDVLRGSASQWISGTAYHCYYGDAAAMTALHNAFPNKDIWFTECSGWHGAADPFPQYFNDTLRWHARYLGIGIPRNWAKSVINWNVALDSQGNPHNGGCGDASGWCTGVVSIDGTTVTRNAEYYTLGHLSRHVRPGATRIGTNIPGDLHNVAFRNPDGSIALFVANVGGGTQNFGVSWNGQHVAYSLPSGAIATLTWPATGGGTDTTAPSTPTGLTATGTTSTSTVLTWTPSTDNVGVTGYTVSRDGVQVGTSATPRFTDSGLTAASTYRYTVTARDAAGNTSAASASVTVTTPPAGGSPLDPGRWYQVVNTNSAKCLDDADWQTGNGARLQQWDCATPVGNNQLWQFRPTSGGYYQVVNRHASSLVWDVNGGTGDGTGVHLWSYVGGANQQWQPTSLGGGAYRFVARHSGKCLDVRDVSTANGASLQQWTCTGGPAQSFTLVARA